MCEFWDADLDGNYADFLCENCGDPAYDCGCEDDSLVLEDVMDNEPCCHGILIGACGCNDEPDDLETQLDAMTERFPNGEDPMITTKELNLTFEAQIEKIPEGDGKDFENWCEKYGFHPLNGGRRAWCSSLGTYMRNADYLVTLIGLSDCLSFFMTEDEVQQAKSQ